MIKYILDTNIVIYVMKRRPLDVLDRFNEHSRQISISAITFVELIYGAEKAKKRNITWNRLKTLYRGLRYWIIIRKRQLIMVISERFSRRKVEL